MATSAGLTRRSRSTGGTRKSTRPRMTPVAARRAGTGGAAAPGRCCVSGASASPSVQAASGSQPKSHRRREDVDVIRTSTASCPATKVRDRTRPPFRSLYCTPDPCGQVALDGVAERRLGPVHRASHGDRRRRARQIGKAEAIEAQPGGDPRRELVAPFDPDRRARRGPRRPAPSSRTARASGSRSVSLRSSQ